MKKIKLQLTANKLKAICQILREIKTEAGPTRKEMANRSILDQVGTKLLKKEIDKSNADKPFKIDLFYYEADVLESILLTWLTHENEKSYYYSIIQIVANALNQKLA